MQTAADAVRISVLGPLEVSDSAGRPVRVGGHRVRALLILLALNPGRGMAASAIIEQLWPDDRPGDAANALQSLVSRLRVALRQGGVPDGVLRSSPAGYCLAVPPDAVDAVAFEIQARAGSQALARGDAEQAADQLRAALARWRGGALTDVAGEEFAFAAVARLTELRSAATLDRIEADLLRGAVDGALVGELRALTAADPLAERPAALLMRALAAGGRQAEALAVYQRTREGLADGLGVSPSPQLEQTYLAILRQEIHQAATHPAGSDIAAAAATDAAAAAVRTAGGAAADGERGLGQAPGPGPRPPAVRRPPTTFVGRDDDVARVLKRLSVERLVTLTGPGGVGKTRLSTETAARLTVPAWFAPLAPVTEAEKVPYAVLEALGLRERSIATRRPESAGDPLDRLCAALADRDAVVILDNCEHVVDAAAALAARLLADCPRVRMLATSREPLQIPGESLHVVTPLAAPPAPGPPGRGAPLRAGGKPAPPRESDATDAARYPAVRLFTDRAAAVHPGFELDPASAGAVARVCRALDGMPLAIELAAPWLRTLTPAQLAERLDDRFALLTGGSRVELPRHQTLRAVVDWSWDLLSGRERALARRLAIFPGGATLAAAEWVASRVGTVGHGTVKHGANLDRTDRGRGDRDGAGPDGPLPARAVLPVLGGLVSKSILAPVAARDPAHDQEPRYRMLETVRAYGTERLVEAGEDTQARDAFARYFLDLAETADPLLRTGEQGRWFRTLTAEQDNLSAALRWAVGRGDAETALRFVRALGYFWVQRGLGEAEALTREVLALPVPPLTQAIAEARVICALLAAGQTWDIDSIREPLTEAIAAFRGFVGEQGDYGDYHPLVAMAEPLLSQYDGATDVAQEQYERYLDASDPWLRAIGQVSMSAYDASLGRLDQAEAHCQAGVAALRAIGERWGVAMGLAQLAEFTELRGDHAASAAALAESAQIGRELGVWGDLTYVQARLALIYARMGDLDRSRAEFANAQRAVEARGGYVDTDRWVMYMQAEVAWRSGDYAESARCCAVLLTAIAGNTAGWWQSLRAQVKSRLAMAIVRQGDVVRCREVLGEAVEAAASWWEHPSLAVVLDACAAYTLAAAGDGAPAAAAAERAARLLGAAQAIRGGSDQSSLDAGPARDAALAVLGPGPFQAAHESARGIEYTAAAALAREAVRPPPPAGRRPE